MCFSRITSVTCVCQLKEKKSLQDPVPGFSKNSEKKKNCVWGGGRGEREEVTVYKKVDKNIGYTCSQDSDPSARLDI